MGPLPPKPVVPPSSGKKRALAATPMLGPRRMMSLRIQLTLLALAFSFAKLTIFLLLMYNADSNTSTTTTSQQGDRLKDQFLLVNRTTDRRSSDTKRRSQKKREEIMHAVSGGLWESSTILPPWMKDYFRWHQQQVQSLTKDNWKSKRYLVLRCLSVDPKCGGASDRLQPVPFALQLANESSRILFIHWDRPAALEEFLLSPVGGMNWSVPEWLHLPFKSDPVIRNTTLLPLAHDSSRIMVDVRYQSNDHGSGYYNRRLQAGEQTFEQVYSEVWRCLFEPSPPVAALLAISQQSHGLVPNQYAAVHIRSLYRLRHINFHRRVENALRCVDQLQPQAPKVYLASDSADVSQYGVEFGGTHSMGRVVAALDRPTPLHLDRGAEFLSANQSDWRLHNASAYYDTFVDLYLLAQARCVALDLGGFARWSRLIAPLGPNASESCAIDHSRKKCGAATAAAATTMVDSVAGAHREAVNPIGNDHDNLWDRSAVLPQWMKDYFAWHRDQLARLNERNWKNETQFRYLIMRCLRIDDRCGGTSDRIKSVPYAILLANVTRRVLFIKWERPHRLEEFLVPPRGGLNWTVPLWLDRSLNLTGEAHIRGSQTSYIAKYKDPIIQMRHQSHDHGSLYYDSNQPPSAPTFQQIYHDAWSVVFEPSLAVAEQIRQVRLDLGLDGASEYAAVHVRSQYLDWNSRSHDQVENALNCATQLQPGAPIYLATDSRNVTLWGLHYGQRQGGMVVGQLPDRDPLHLDRGSNFLSAYDTDLDGRPPSDFYDTFVDLYLLAGGRCTLVGAGGYGRWANSISANHTCALDHTQVRCNWTTPAAALASSL